MYTDMVGYTALGQRNESLSLALVEEQRKLIRPILSRHNGREVKTMGDAFLVEFLSALEAVRCAYDIQRATREFNISLSEEKRIHLRVGIHLGDVVESQGDISGDAVNVASRIEPLAEDGGVCLTRQVYDHVQNKFELPLRTLGPRNLKNVSGTIEVYRVELPWGPAQPAAAPELNRKRIAVLPFTNLSPNLDDEYFADGLTEEVITSLSQLSGLEVIARTSVMRYKDDSKPVSVVGTDLRVGSVLEGSVRKAGSKIRITAQLIDVATESHVWANNYDRELDDIFNIQGDVANKVAGALQVRLLSTDKTKLEGLQSSDIDAYAIYLRAVHLLYEASEQGLREAVALFSKATTRDPKFARAYAGLAQAWLGLALGYEDFGTAVGNAEIVAAKALAADPSLAEAHAAMADVDVFLDRFDQAQREAEEAVRINPNLAAAHRTISQQKALIGKTEEALEAGIKALELDPLYFNFLLPALAHVAGNDRVALETIRRWREVYPRNPVICSLLAEHYLLTGDFAKAQGALDMGFAMGVNEDTLLACQGVLFAVTGRREEAVGVLKRLDSVEVESSRLFGQVMIDSVLGNLDQAFVGLMRQAETHSWYALIKIHPFFENMRGDPRFSVFCTKVGIPT